MGRKESKQTNKLWFLFTGIKCFNPAFDVTPAELITGGIITEYGVFPADQLYQSLRNLDISCLNALPRSKSKAKFQMHK